MAGGGSSGKVAVVFMTVLTALLTSFAAFADGLLSASSANTVTSFSQVATPTLGRVNAILRDNRGLLWVGTSRGLCSYDGYAMRHFPNGPRQDSKQEMVTALMKLSDDSLLVGTTQSLFAFDLRSGRFTRFGTIGELAEAAISALARDSAGTIWIGTSSLGLFSFDPRTRLIQHHTGREGPQDPRITALLVDHSGTLRIGTVGKGLYTLIPDKMTILPFGRGRPGAHALRSDHVTALCEPNARELWVGTDEAVYILNRATGSVRRLALPSDLPRTVSSIVCDSSGRTWVAALDLGLFAYEGGKWARFSSPADQDRSLNAITAIHLDPVETSRTSVLLWVGTHIGIDRVTLSQSPFTAAIRGRYSLQMGRGAVLSFCEDRKGTLWVGLWGGGLNGFRPANGSYRRVASITTGKRGPLVLPNNDVQCVWEDGAGRLWVGTMAGLAVLDRRWARTVIFRHRQSDTTSLASDRISKIWEDRSGTLWLCSSGGLIQVREEKPGKFRFRNFLSERGDAHPLGRNEISDILQDHRSRLWVSTYGRGLNRLEADGTFTRFLHPDDSAGTGENWIYRCIEDRNGLFWLSTSSGLVRFEPQTGRFERVPVAGLHDAVINDILEDSRGGLWLPTQSGLLHYSPASQRTTRIGRVWGFPFRELFSGFYRDHHGRVFVGGIDGFVAFDPDSVSETSRHPQVLLTDFAVFDSSVTRSVTVSGPIHLTYDQNFFSLTFAVLDYSDPDRNKFAYRLEGVEAEWVDAGNRNYVRYTHLDPGTYVFRVKGSNSKDVWSTTEARLQIIISPPYWGTLWFRLLLATVLAGALYLLYVYRVRRILEVQRLRLRIADDLHDEVGSNLSTIAMISRVIQRSPDLTQPVRQRIAEIYETAISTSEGMKDIVWFIKPQNDRLDDLLLRLKDTASSLLACHEYAFSSSVEDGALQLSIAFRRHFYLAFKEMLANIVKHSQARTVQIQVQQRRGMLEAIIRDDGRGFDPGHVRRGNGLQSLEARARSIGGVCEIRAGQDGGTEVRFAGRL